ncbi:MAG: glycosyltransferase [Planctomycetota bacterium]
MTGASGVDISLVIPAWNESSCLPRLLDTVDAARACYRGGPERVEVIVADNGSTDGTADIARERGARVVPVEKRCIAAARNGGAEAARGEILCFCDADFRIHEQTFNVVAEVMARPGVVGGGTGLVPERWSPGLRATFHLILLPLGLFGLDGGAWFCRHADWKAAGGYDERMQAGEDMFFLMRLARIGRARRPRERLMTARSMRRIGIEPAIAISSTRKFDERGDWHMVPFLLKAIVLFAFSRRRYGRIVNGYWYEGR